MDWLATLAHFLVLAALGSAVGLLALALLGCL